MHPHNPFFCSQFKEHSTTTQRPIPYQ
uniref:Uncharacterized protein LOC105127834 n=1 Tax=Rhizophora mucronata TaxID=61149 RepID=A0A2P2J7E9_RHIMU